MSKVVKGARFISKITDVPGVEPTIPPNDDHTLGWRDTDIYVGEWFWNITDSKIFFRDGNGIGQLVTPNSNGQIDPSLLPGNYIGAMVYRGVWDASSGDAPGISIGRLTPEKGDYYIVSVSGNTNLDGITDWQVGDYAIYNGVAWDKIDNTEPIIYANNVLYDYSHYPSITQTKAALDKIFDEKFVSPQFDETVVISDASLTVDKSLLELNGNTNKWITWDNSKLKLGSHDNTNTTVSIVPKNTSGSALSSALDLSWLDGSGNETLRWRGYTSNTQGYIDGYTDDGTTTTVRISSTGDGYFNAGNVGFGLTSPSERVDVSGNVKADAFISASNTIVGTNTSGVVRIRPVSYSSNSGETIFSGTLAHVSTDAQFDGDIDTQSIGVSNTLAVSGDTALSATTFYDKASYNDYTAISITSSGDVVHKDYVDTQIANHAVGFWASGTTFTSTDRDIVLYSSSTTYYVGVNKQNPTYNLDVVGNALISSTLTVNGNVTANNNVNVSHDIKFIGSSTGDVSMYIEQYNGTPKKLSILGQKNTSTTQTHGGLIDIIAGTGSDGTSGDAGAGGATLVAGGTGGLIGVDGYNGGDGGTLTLRGGTGGDVFGVDAQPGNGGDVAILGGEGGQYSSSSGGLGGNVAIRGGESHTEYSKAGDVQIYPGLGVITEDTGKIWIDHIINEPFVIDEVFNSSSMPTFVVDVIRMRNIINIRMLSTSEADNSTNGIEAYIGWQEEMNHDVYVFVQGHLQVQNSTSDNTIRIFRGTSGTPGSEILRFALNDATGSGNFACLLLWNHVIGAWNVMTQMSNGAPTLSTPSGTTV